MIIPCVDLSCGTPRSGGKSTDSGTDEIVHLVESLARCGEVTINDADSEALEGDNTPLIKSLCARFRCRVTGGIRNQEMGRALLRSGAERIIVGCDASPDLIGAFRREHLILAIDGSPGVEKTRELFERYGGMSSGFLLENPPLADGGASLALEEIRKLAMSTDVRMCVATERVQIDDVAALDRMGVDVQLGRSLIEGRISAPEGFARCMRWDDDGCLPTVVQDASGQVLMVARSSARSLEITLNAGEGTYVSGDSGGLWRKGERSGNDQLVLGCRASNDRRSLLMTVRQAGSACDSGSYSCFGQRDFNLDFLSRIAASKRSGDPSVSYTARLLDDPKAIGSRIREKAEAVYSARHKDETLWAISDLVYFVVVKAVSKNLTWSDVVRELRGRQR